MSKRREDLEGLIYRVISRPSDGPAPMGLTFTQYSTCFAHNIDKYVAHGWRDEAFESAVAAARTAMPVGRTLDARRGATGRTHRITLERNQSKYGRNAGRKGVHRLD